MNELLKRKAMYRTAWHVFWRLSRAKTRNLLDNPLALEKRAMMRKSYLHVRRLITELEKQS